MMDLSDVMIRIMILTGLGLLLYSYLPSRRND